MKEETQERRMNACLCVVRVPKQICKHTHTHTHKKSCVCERPVYSGGSRLENAGSKARRTSADNQPLIGPTLCCSVRALVYEDQLGVYGFGEYGFGFRHERMTTVGFFFLFFFKKRFYRSQSNVLRLGMPCAGRAYCSPGNVFNLPSTPSMQMIHFDNQCSVGPAGRCRTMGKI